MSNIAGIIAGHPLDTIRVRMQMETRKITTRHCLYETLTNEGFLSLWKGLGAPLVGAIPLNTLVFMATEYSKRTLGFYYPQMSSANSSLIAGSMAGVMSLAIFVPGDLLKCRA